jgi:hypothetical protein
MNEDHSLSEWFFECVIAYRQTGKVALLHAMEALWVRGGIAPTLS